MAVPQIQSQQPDGKRGKPGVLSQQPQVARQPLAPRAAPRPHNSQPAPRQQAASGEPGQQSRGPTQAAAALPTGASLQRPAPGQPAPVQQIVVAQAAAARLPPPAAAVTQQTQADAMPAEQAAASAPVGTAVGALPATTPAAAPPVSEKQVPSTPPDASLGSALSC